MADATVTPREDVSESVTTQLERQQQQVIEMLLIPDPLSPNTIDRCQRRLTHCAKASIPPPEGLRRSTRTRKQRQYLELMEDNNSDHEDEMEETNDKPEEVAEKKAKEGDGETANEATQKAEPMEEKKAAPADNHSKHTSVPPIDLPDDDESSGSHPSTADEAKFKLAKKPGPVQTTEDETFILPPATTLLLERQSTMDHLMHEAMPLTLSPGVTEWYQQGISAAPDDDDGSTMDARERDRLLMEHCRALVVQWPPLATQINDASVRAKDGRIVAPPLLPPSQRCALPIEPNVCNSDNDDLLPHAGRCRTKLDRMIAPGAYPQQVQKLRRVSKYNLDEAMEFIKLPSTPLQSLETSKDGRTKDVGATDDY